MNKRHFKHRYDHKLEPMVDGKGRVSRLRDHRRRRMPVIRARQGAHQLCLTPGWCRLGVGPGHQLIDARCRPQIDELGERVGHPRQRIDTIQLTGLDQRRRNCPVFGTEIVPGEEGVFPGQYERTDRTLDRIGIELDATIIKEADEPIPMVEAITDDIGKRRTLGYFCKVPLQPWLQRLDNRLRPRLALGTTHIRGATADLLLYRIELGDANERLRRDRRIATGVDLVELPPEVAPTKGQYHTAAGTAGMRQLFVDDVSVNL